MFHPREGPNLMNPLSVLPAALTLAAVAAASGPETPPQAPDGGHAPNRLIHETSPYLLQHAYNPVDWYAWGPEAFEAARDADKPIFLSIGYSTCYWCHVMERESFEDEGTAAIMNELVIAIKVDREERPDVDDIYMSAVQTLTGRGGWPMSVFLDPYTLKPFNGGTYYRRAAFQNLLTSIDNQWRNNREPLLEMSCRFVIR